jgi:hypothetical protein
MDLNKIGCEFVVWLYVAVTSFHAVLNVIRNCWGHKSGNSLGQLSVSYFFQGRLLQKTCLEFWIIFKT